MLYENDGLLLRWPLSLADYNGNAGFQGSKSNFHLRFSRTVFEQFPSQPAS